MFKFLQNQKFPTILLVLGFLLIVASSFHIADITKLQISVYAQPVYAILILGILLTIASVVLYLFEDLTIGWIKSIKVSARSNGFGIEFKQSKINLLFGRIEALADDSPSSLVVLPANEFFDDECIHDSKSTLGAYVNSKFPNLIGDVQSLVAEELNSFQPSELEEVEKEQGVFQKSYGIGTGVFLKNPLDSKQPLLFLSVTTKRAGEGVRADMSYFFSAIQEVQRVVADKRLDSVLIPVIGSGHGGLKKEVALFGLLLVICDSVTKPSGHHLKDINVVVFQKDQNAKPSVSKTVARRLLKTAAGMYI